MTKLKEYCFRRLYKKDIPNTRYLTHGIHSYTAKLIPHIPRYFIERFTEKDETILDPFCGSGSSLVESKILGRNSLGVDINPLAKLLTEVKTTPIEEKLLVEASKGIEDNIEKCENSMEIDFPNKDHWFSEIAQRELGKIRFCIEDLRGTVDERLYKFLQVCFSSIIRKSSNADTGMAKTYNSKRVRDKILSGWVPKPPSYFRCTMKEFSQRIIEFGKKVGLNDEISTQVFAEDVKEYTLPSSIDTVDLIITSPPYINAQDYFRSYKLELLWLGLASYEEIRKLDKKAIGTERVSSEQYSQLPKFGMKKVDKTFHKLRRTNKKKAYIVFKYFKDMSAVIEKCYNWLRSGGYFCLVVGDNTICNTFIPTHNVLAAIAKNSGFKLKELGRDAIKSRSLFPQRNHDAGVIKDEWVIVLHKKN